MALQPATKVHRACDATIIDELGHEHVVSCTLEYGVRDSFAVTLTVSTETRSVPWVFARDLLRESLFGPTGAGDVHLWPTLATDGRAMTAVELTNASAVALILLSTRDVADFLDASFLAVPSGHEAIDDFDAALRNLLAEQG